MINLVFYSIICELISMYIGFILFDKNFTFHIGDQVSVIDLVNTDFYHSCFEQSIYVRLIS